MIHRSSLFFRRTALLAVIGLATLLPRAVAQEVTMPNGKAPKIVCLIAEGEYQAKEKVPGFMNALKAKYGFQIVVAINPTPGTRGFGADRHNIPHMSELKDADLVYLQARRRGLPAEDMELLRAYFARGGALVATRTASHAFAPHSPKEDEGIEPAALKAFNSLARWGSFDREVLGCRYHGHYGAKAGGTIVRLVPGMEEHPILQGVPAEGYRSVGTLYKSRPLDSGCQVLLTGANNDGNLEPIAWTNRYGGSRIFYTSLGHWEDWDLPGFSKMLENAIFWALGLKVPE